MAENYWKWIWTGAMVSVLSLITILCYFDYIKDVRMAELGFQKETIVGSQSTLYHKIK